MAERRSTRIILWAVLIASPFLSVLAICLVSGTDLVSLDAWSTTWNDEQRYYRTIVQMHAIGYPSGAAGYNEVLAPYPSYGPYSIFAYVPYYLGAFFTGIATHNFMYYINMAFGVISAVLVVVILRPNVRESLLCIAFFLLQFILARYYCSGMTEAAYVLFASLFGSCMIFVAKHAENVGKRRLVVAALVVAVLAIGFWGLMRPFLLAFMLAIWFVLAWHGLGLDKPLRIGLFAFSVVVTFICIAVFLYISKYYATPYFYGDTIANDFFGRVFKAVPSIVSKHVDSILYSGAKLVKLEDQGVIMLTFAAGWTMLLVMAIRAHKRGERVKAALFMALVVAGFAIFEAHMLLYRYQQMQRTMISADVVYVLTIVWFGCAKAKKVKVTARLVLIGVTSLLCVIALFIRPADFALPQARDGYDKQIETAQRAEFERIMPRSDDLWANTIAHPIEARNIRMYFNAPDYMNMNTLQIEYLEKAAKKRSFKSKYVSVPSDYEQNEIMAKNFEVIYDDGFHIIYKVHE